MDALEKTLYILAGPTASGKTGLSLEIASNLDAEIICVDSMTIYKYMNIGTAKVSEEERKQVKHHLIDICDPWEDFSVQKFIDLCSDAIENIWARGKNILLVVGTPLYLKTLLYGIFSGPKADWDLRNTLEKESSEKLHEQLKTYDSVAAQRISVNDRKRMIRALEVFFIMGRPISLLQKELTVPQKKYSYCICCLDWNRDVLYARVEKRVDIMLEKGLIEETKQLLGLPFPLSQTAKKAIGYKDVIDLFEGRLTVEELPGIIKRNTRRYAKRQMTWWRKFDLHWISLDTSLSQECIIKNIMEKYNSTVKHI